MSKVLAIAGREIRSYFTSPLAYVIIGFFLLATGYFFSTYVAFYSLASLRAGSDPVLAQHLNVHEGLIRPLQDNVHLLFLFVIPLLSMRLLAEEKKQATAELLLTAPVRTWELVLGKFAGALGFIAVLLALTAQYPLFLWIAGATPAAGPLMASALGTALLAAAFLSVGLFMSSLTENQIVAAITSFVLLLILWVIGFTGEMVSGSLSSLFKYLSLMENAEVFARGVIDTDNLVFFATFIFFNLFLTSRAIESRRWR